MPKRRPDRKFPKPAPPRVLCLSEPPRLAFTASSLSPSVAIVNVNALRKVGDEFWVLCRSDVHWDNPHCLRDLEKRHLDEAVKRGAAIIDGGDLFCAMQGKYDKRSDKSAIRPEHQHGNYLDRLVDTAIDYYAPYAHHFAVIGRGNHETSIKTRHETDLQGRLVEGLRRKTGSRVVCGGYSGWVRFQFNITNTSRKTLTLWYHHGYGGGGPVTKDMIQSNRQLAYVEGADVMMTGHVHYRWQDEPVKIFLSQEGEVRHRPITYVKCGTYKEEYGDGSGGWHVETGKPPKPVGGWWLRFVLARRGGRGSAVINIDTLKTSNPEPNHASGNG